MIFHAWRCVLATIIDPFSLTSEGIVLFFETFMNVDRIPDVFRDPTEIFEVFVLDINYFLQQLNH